MNLFASAHTSTPRASRRTRRRGREDGRLICRSVALTSTGTGRTASSSDARRPKDARCGRGPKSDASQCVLKQNTTKHKQNFLCCAGRTQAMAGHQTSRRGPNPSNEKWLTFYSPPIPPGLQGVVLFVQPPLPSTPPPPLDLPVRRQLSEDEQENDMKRMVDLICE